ncbi:MAG: hypothetical protein Q4E99_03295, partial [Bacillota bacterium]|nr:hypothetical protein [Bacillota bacterium]
MTIKEYIEDDLPFYHVTKMSSKPLILDQGLLAKRCNAICVVRNCDNDILYEIIRQIGVPESGPFAVIKLIPSKHGITVDMVCEDSVDEKTAPLHNYIVKDKINISKEDFCINDYTPSESDCMLDDSKIIAL